VGLLAAPLVVWQIFRVATFDAWLPNTFDLKLGGIPLAPRLARGLATTLPFAVAAAPLAALALSRESTAARGERRLLFALAAVFPAYAVWIGGDAWDEIVPLAANRFQALALPLLALLAAPPLRAACRALAARAASPALRATILPAAAVALLVWVNGRPGWNGWREGFGRTLVSEPPPQCEVAMHVLERLRVLERRLPPGATVGTVWAGIPGFYSRFALYDLLGYNDRRIARQPPRAGRTLAEWRAFWPGHVKWDRALALDIDRPEAFFQVPRVWPPGSSAALEAAGYRPWRGFWLREDTAAGAQGSGGG
jgi:hypothetical protein